MYDDLFGVFFFLIFYVFNMCFCDNDLYLMKLYDKFRNLINEVIWSFLFIGVKLIWEDDSCRYDVF